MGEISSKGEDAESLMHSVAIISFGFPDKRLRHPECLPKMKSVDQEREAMILCPEPWSRITDHDGNVDVQCELVRLPAQV